MIIWLENPGGLPKNPSPTIDTTPKIVSLSPASGKVGEIVTIAGRNFGDVEGNSTISFNNTMATPIDWTAASMLINVLAGASSGNVIVTVNGVASSGVNFTVVQPAAQNVVQPGAQNPPIGLARLQGASPAAKPPPAKARVTTQTGKPKK